eukprot:COSAG05_NODE_16422_length_346_cov_1.040486_1_plen_35_part_01
MNNDMGSERDGTTENEKICGAWKIIKWGDYYEIKA